MKSITEAQDLNGKRVLVRVDWNVPIKDGVVINSFRIKESLPTLEYLKNAGAKVIIATHLEKGDVELLQQFVPEGARLLPNLRENPGEENNSEDFARELASGVDIYVNEAFSVSHRNHASIITLPKILPSYAGLRLVREVAELSKAFYPPHPFLLLLGGAKIETKLPLLERFSNIADSIFIGGAMAKSAATMPFANNPKIFFPTGDLSALDANAETLEILKAKIVEAKFIIWNGPLGQYETGYVQYTEELAMVLAEAKASVIVGGGDTLAVIQNLNILDKFSFVSTGGGAMLAFLAQGTLPGIEALK
ncbi:MAG: phosphoglycerate kinase [Candidatus Zambryskibacteria bacterium]|nr:phosphoglycerate kinase [Candidatus Zambryskibacteria bacterium]